MGCNGEWYSPTISMVKISKTEPIPHLSPFQPSPKRSLNCFRHLFYCCMVFSTLGLSDLPKVTPYSLIQTFCHQICKVHNPTYTFFSAFAEMQSKISWMRGRHLIHQAMHSSYLIIRIIFIN